MADPGTIGVAASARREGGEVAVTLRLDIPDNTHIEAHEPPDPLLIPTVARFEAPEATDVSYPEPVEKDLGLPGPPLLVYEGTVAITGKGPADDTVETAAGTIRYQPCVGGACLPPREHAWEAPIQPAEGA